ncbi:MAG: complex subunit [Sphingomonas bacterium]|jgi:hypothetical protein|nr:ETC complex I subunit [Sphingomonas bacterium]MDB5690756.1 complex subunit [Sphingomonas bacterium]
MATARIYQEGKSSMQSGRARAGRWVLQHESSEAKRADPLTGWTGSGDTRDQISLAFPSLEAARAYAEKHALDYHVVPAATRTLKLQTYADNFK